MNLLTLVFYFVKNWVRYNNYITRWHVQYEDELQDRLVIAFDEKYKRFFFQLITLN